MAQSDSVASIVVQQLRSRQWVNRQLRHWMTHLMDPRDLELTGWEFKQRSWLIISCARFMHLAILQGRWSLLDGMRTELNNAKLLEWLQLLQEDGPVEGRIIYAQAMVRWLELMLGQNKLLPGLSDLVSSWLKEWLSDSSVPPSLVEAMSPMIVSLPCNDPPLASILSTWINNNLSMDGRAQLAVCLSRCDVVTLSTSQCSLLIADLKHANPEWITVILSLTNKTISTSLSNWLDAGLALALLLLIPAVDTSSLIYHDHLLTVLMSLASHPVGLRALEEAGLWDRLATVRLNRDWNKALVIFSLQTERRLAPRQLILTTHIGDQLLHCIRQIESLELVSLAATVISVSVEQSDSASSWLDDRMGLSLVLAMGGSLVRGLRRLEHLVEAEKESAASIVAIIRPTVRVFAKVAMEGDLIARLVKDADSEEDGSIRMPISVLVRLLTSLLPQHALSLVDSLLLIILRWLEIRLGQFDDRLVTGNLAIGRFKQGVMQILSRPLEQTANLPWEKLQSPQYADSIQRWVRELKQLLLRP